MSGTPGTPGTLLRLVGVGRLAEPKQSTTHTFKQQDILLETNKLDYVAFLAGPTLKQLEV